MRSTFAKAEVLKSLEGEAEENFPSLDTIAISGRQGCPCCGSNLILVGDFDNKDQAEEEMRRILSGNQYRNPKGLDKIINNSDNLRIQRRKLCTGFRLNG